jgi:hypothetical protein
VRFGGLEQTERGVQASASWAEGGKVGHSRVGSGKEGKSGLLGCLGWFESSFHFYFLFFSFLNLIQTKFEFKFEFEFKPHSNKIMHQHECNKKI